MLLPINSRIRTFLFILMALVASQATQASPAGNSPAHALRSNTAHRTHQVFLTRLPRTNKARKYDIYFLNQLPRQATASAPVHGSIKSNDI